MTSDHEGSIAPENMESGVTVLKRIQDHDGLISLMQAQIEFQTELINKHDKIFADLSNKVQDLSSKVKTLEEQLNKGAQSREYEAATSALWSSSTSGGGDKNKASLADMVKEAAEQTLGTESGPSGFVFDDKLGLYFDQSSGYYYDPVKQLYYNGHTKTFYSYDAATNTYKVHSSNSVKRKKKATKTIKQTKHISLSSNSEKNINTLESQPQSVEGNENIEDTNSIDESTKMSPATSRLSDMEEGEISSSMPTSAESSPRACSNESKSCEESSEEENEQANYPPCIRAVVQEALNSSDLKKGSLFLVPYTGGTIGSSGDHHVILLPTESVEENHAKIHYEQSNPLNNGLEKNDGKYFVTDLGSHEGTFLNKTRLSDSGETSEPQEVVHGSTLQVGDIVLLIHIHPGDFTCGHCEPGLILQKEPLYEYTSKSGESVRRSEIKKIKKKYGLDRKNPNSSSSSQNVPEPKYVDRAKNRRIKLGSDNPFAKTEVASTNTPIRESNVGFKMMQKMGWKGEGLGTSENQGIKEPIKCEGKTDRLGLGLQNVQVAPTSAASSTKLKSSKEQRRLENLAKTVERFNEAT